MKIRRRRNKSSAPSHGAKCSYFYMSELFLLFTQRSSMFVRLVRINGRFSAFFKILLKTDPSLICADGWTNNNKTFIRSSILLTGSCLCKWRFQQFSIQKISRTVASMMGAPNETSPYGGLSA